MSDHAGRDTVSSLKTGLNALLTPEESVLVLIDHQPFQFANPNSHEPTMIVNNVIGLAKFCMTELRKGVSIDDVPLTSTAVV
jgi:hypothetical protein